MTLYCATGNAGKLREFRLAGELLGIDVLPLEGLKSIPAPEETGATFEENALIKAEYYSRFAKGPRFADDSGLEVDVLGGAPGVQSGRYAGAHATDEANNRLLLQRMERVPDAERQCAFVCALAAARDGKTLNTFTAEARGTLLRRPTGSNGFGYDPLFYFPNLGRSFAELSREEKLKVSHRGAAFRMFLQWMKVRHQPSRIT